MVARPKVKEEARAKRTFLIKANKMRRQDNQPHIVVNKTRVQDKDGFPATIRYVGKVASAKNQTEIYIGVEWDDPTRGKHDGSVISRGTGEVARHFQTNDSGNTAGSFLRLSKVDFGTELNLSVMKSRYVGEEAELVAPDNKFQDCYARTTKGFTKPIELLGEVKIRKKQQLQDLTAISLRSLGIAKVEHVPSFEFLTLGARYVEVDLGSNLFSDWCQMAEVLKVFPNVENMSWASNKIGDFDLPNSRDHFTLNQYTEVTVLNLNHCNIQSFQTAMIVAQSMPNLQELYLSGNDLSNVHKCVSLSPPKCNEIVDVSDNLLHHNYLLQNLSLIDCSECNLTSWADQVNCFGFLPQLKTLILDNNSITSIESQVSIESSSCEENFSFPELTTLQIASNAIVSWKSIDALSSKYFPNLCSLRFRNNPVTQSIAAGEARAATIARIGGTKLSYMNASRVSDRERIESERRYVRNVARELLLLNNTDDKDNVEEAEIIAKKEMYILNHPRFCELMKTHAKSMMGVDPFATNSSNGSNSLNAYGSIGNASVMVTIKSMASATCTVEPLRKRLPLSLSIQRLKHICCRAFELDIEFQSLSLKNDPKDPFPTLMDNDESTLAQWGVVENAEIWMEEIDPEIDEREKAKENEAHDEKMLMQERLGDVRKSELKREKMEYVAAATKAASGHTSS